VETVSPPSPPINRAAIFSFLAAILTIIAYCIGAFPVPLTGYVCFPTSAIMGLIALVTGVIALGQIRSKKQGGRAFALFGTIVGTLTGLIILCVVPVGIFWLPRIISFLHQIIK
jgi:hypothetical protein